MKYLGDVYCGKSEDCVIFEKYRNLKGMEYAAFICICSEYVSKVDGMSLCRYAVRRLQEWVRRYVQKVEKLDYEPVFKGLEEEVYNIRRELGVDITNETGYLAGGVWFGNRGVVFASGKVQICQINKLFGRGHVRILRKGVGEMEQIKFLEMQSGVGLLFLAEDAGKCLGTGMIVECLGNDRVEGEAWVHKRVRELGRFGQESLAYLTLMEV